MDLAVWLNFISPSGPCFDPKTLPIPGSPCSLAMIDALVERHVDRSRQREIRVLEIGSFCGISALTWAHALARLGVDAFTIYCVDMWYHAPLIHHAPEALSVTMQRNAFNHDLFKFNIAKAGMVDHIVEVIGDSRVALRGMRSNFFDFVYIDGFHGHDVVAQDIENGFRVCKTGGVICGDDYDCPHKMLEAVPPEGRQQDGYSGTHPGVVLAVDELLGVPRQYGSFWAFEKFSDRSHAPFHTSMVALDVSAFPRRVPPFIPAELHPWFESFLRQPTGFPPGHPMTAEHGPAAAMGKVG
jgi:predicted O-methyltransferase YrrM